MSKMRTTNPKIGSAGFSMIDVLVAIVVLATALLALAALQGALTRNNADARARSQIVAFSEGLLDQMRSSGYDNIAAATITPSNASGATAQQKQAYNAQLAAGVSGLTTTIASTAYYGSTAGTGGSFSTTAPSNLNSQTPRYKQVKVTTAWTDATGQSRSVSLDTVVSPLTTSSDNSLDSQSLSITGSSTPVVREYNPGATAGVIPIAIGSTQQTAATNPKPELLALNGNNSAVVGTSFNVLTYKNADNDNLSIIQQRVDTLVVACTCAFGGAVTADGNSDFEGVVTQPYRPTYWDGSRYVEPSKASTATSATGIDTTVTQSPYCDICCRDHNDSATDEIKFDPWNTSSSRYKHYRYNAGVLEEATSGSYVNACRLIRVGGSYAVATDLNNYFFALLATSSPASSSTTAKSPVPDTTDTTDFGTGGAVAKYQSFVLNYLQSNVSSLEQNQIPSVSTTATTYGGSSYSLDIPTNIAITYSSSSTDYRYLHSRGLYVDYLEPVAVTAISNAITNCTSQTTSDCYLPILPFTTINLSEIANWSVTTTSANCTSPTQAIAVNNQSIISEDFNSSRGVVTSRQCAAAGESSTVQAKMRDSNSGLAAQASQFAAAVDPDDESHFQTDTQVFSKSGSSSGGSGTVAGTLTLTGTLPQIASSYSGSIYPTNSWQLDSVAAPSGSLQQCPATFSNGGKLTGYACPAITTASAAPISAVITLKVQNYNYAYTKNQSNPCGSGNKPAQYCQNYQVDLSKVYVNGAQVSLSSSNVVVTNDGKVTITSPTNTAELSTITLPSVTLQSTNTISVGFSLQGETVTTPTCSGTTPVYPACP